MYIISLGEIPVFISLENLSISQVQCSFQNFTWRGHGPLWLKIRGSFWKNGGSFL